MNNYDVIIKSAPKDYSKLDYVIPSIRFLVPQPENIYIVSPDGYIPQKKNSYSDSLIAIKDEDVFFDIDRDKIPFRKNWVFATFIALFQDFTKNDYYLDIQADNIFTSEIELFSKNGNPRFFISREHDHYHMPYYNFSMKFFDLGRVYSSSFIIDFMLYKKSITRELLINYGSFERFFEISTEFINENCYPTDQDLYGNWCIQNKYGYEIIKDVNVNFVGIYYPGKFSKLQINSLIKRSNKYSALSIHTWGDETTLSNKKRNKIMNIYIKLNLWFPKTIGILTTLIRKIKRLCPFRR